MSCPKSNFQPGSQEKCETNIKLPNQSNQHRSPLGLAFDNVSNDAAKTCDVCQTVFSDRQSMMRHRWVHSERKRGKIKHPQISKGYDPEISEGMENSMQQNTERMKDSPKGDRGKPTCDICQKVFTIQFMMLRHRQKHVSEKEGHMGENIHKDKANSESHSKKKMKRSSGSSCDICQLVFPLRTSMVSHRQVHYLKDERAMKMGRHQTAKDDVARCDICDKAFAIRLHMLQHRKLHFSNEDTPVRDDDSGSLNKEVDSPEDKTEEGSVADDSPKDVETAAGKQTDGTCDICGKTYCSKPNMLRHRKTHFEPSSEDLKQRTCTLCDLIYADKYCLRNHLNLVHSGTNKPEIHEREDVYVSPKSSVMTDEEMSKGLSDSKVENESVTQHIIEQDESEKIDQMMGSTGNTECLICHKEFVILKVHVKGVHMNLRPHKCKFCGYAFQKKGDLKRHLQRKQSCRTGPPVQYSRMAAKDIHGKHQNRGSVRSLPRKSKRISETCPVCSKVFFHKSVMLRHQRLEHPVEPENFVRENEPSAEKTETHEHWDIHVSQKSRTKNDQETSEDLGDSQLENENKTQQIDQDEREKIDEMIKSTRITQCLICYKKFATCWTLKVHVKGVHLKLRPYKCKFCGYAFQNKGDLKRHLQRKQSCRTGPPAQYSRMAGQDSHGKHQNRSSGRSLPRKAKRISETCPVCSKVFFHKSVMLRHQRLEHPVKPKNLVRENEPSAEKTETHEHVDIHVSQKSRTKNDQETSENLDDSQLENENKTQQIDQDEREKIDEMIKSTGITQCLICYKKFATCWTLKMHVKGVHLKLRPYKCKFCGFTFKQKGNMTGHIRRKHSLMSRERSVQYQRMASTNKHRRHWHGSPVRRVLNKPEVNSKTCPICSKTFVQRSSMLKHKRLLHILGPANSVRDNERMAQKTEMHEHEDLHISRKTCVMNNQEKSRVSADSEIENLSETEHNVEQDERDKIDEMMKSTGNLRCLICHKKFTRYVWLKLHVKSAHVNPRLHKSQSFVERRNLAIQIQRMRPAQHQRMAEKDKCGRQHNWHTARKLLRKPDKKTETCSICAKVFSHRSVMLRHKMLVHTEEPRGNKTEMHTHVSPEFSVLNDETIRRDLDDSEIEHESDAQHIVDEDEREKIDKMMRSTKNSKCLICHKKFVLLKQHVQAVHLQIRPYKCKFCGYVCHQERDLARHLQRKQSCGTGQPVQHQKMASKNKYGRQWKGSARRLLRKSDSMSKTCPVCTKVFSHRSVMLRHNRLHHIPEPENPVKENEAEAKKTQMQEDILPKPSVMDERDLDDTKKKDDRETQQIVDEDEREKIDEMMRSPNNSKCLICHKEFVMLKVHVKGVHMNLRPHKCKFCGYAFQKKCDLKRHLQRKQSCRTDPPYKCKYCRHAFAQKDDLKSHLKAVHGDIQADSGSVQDSEQPSKKTPLKNIKCDICKKLFITNFGMLRHKTIHTPDNTYSDRVPMSPHDTRRDTQTTLDCEESESQTSDVEIPANPTLLNDQESSRDLSDSKVNTESDTRHVVDQDGRKNISETLRIASKDEYGSDQNWRPARRLQTKVDLKTCSVCSKVFSQRYIMLRHKRLDHTAEPENSFTVNDSLLESSEITTVIRTPENTSARKDAAIENGAQPDVIKSKYTREDRTCDVCHKVFNYRIELLRHKRLKHPAYSETSVKDSKSEQEESPHMKTTEKESSEFPYVDRYSKEERTCAFCEKLFPSRREMLQHHQMHIAKYVRAMVKVDAKIEKDSLCIQVETPLEYPTEMAQEERETIKDMLESNYNGTKCTICQKDLKRRSFLIGHINGVHLKLKPHKCKYCKHAFALSHNLKAHLKTVHRGMESELLTTGHRDTHADSLSVQDSEPLTTGHRDTHADSGSVQDSEPPTTGHRDTHADSGSVQDSEPLTTGHRDTHADSGSVQDSEPPTTGHRDTHADSGSVQDSEPLTTGHRDTHADSGSVQDSEPPTTGHRDTHADSGSVQDSVPPTEKTQLQNIECDICKKLFITNFSMIRHKTTHKSDDLVQEEVPCNLHVKTPTRDPQTSLVREENETQSSNPTESIEVMPCSWDSLQSIASSPSVKSAHSSISVHSPRSSHIVGSLMDQRVYPCTKCYHIFTNSDDWREHLSQHVCEGTKTVCSEDKNCYSIEKIECDICKKLFVTNFSMLRHKTTHTSDNVLRERIPPNLHDTNNPTKDTHTSHGCEENENHISHLEIPKSRHRNSSGTSESSQSQPSVISSHSSESVHSTASMLLDKKAYKCTKCDSVFTSSEQWREHLKQHLGGGTNRVHFEEKDCDLVKCEDGEQTTENSWCYTCPACKVEVHGSFDLVMHIKEHMMQRSY